MKPSGIIALIPDDVLEFLSAETQVDYKVHKLSGRLMLKLILYSLLTTSKGSLRVMETIFNSATFKAFAELDGHVQTRYNSIRDRIHTIRSEYFERLFHSCYDRFSAVLNRQSKPLMRYDSTMVALSGKLLSLGMRTGSNIEKKLIKFTIGFDGLLPRMGKLFTRQQHLSEDLALRETILETSLQPAEMVVFDRGLQSRNTFSEFDAQGLYFVTRLKTNSTFLVERELDMLQQQAPELQQAESLTIDHDELVRLYGPKGKLHKQAFRLIRARITASNEEIWFLTNILEWNASQIAAIYKQRWEIEVFFKFLKQELNFDHVLVKSENAVKVMLYTTLIAAMLLQVYKHFNNLKGYKIPKLRFALELEEELLKKLILICGGKPEIFFTKT